METTQGYLTVNVSTARGAIPIGGASVVVYDDAGRLVASVTTDKSGKSPTLALDAPSKSLGMSPSPSEKPYASYAVEVIRDGYYSVTNGGVPIFAGITSIQPVELLPLAEYDSEIVYPSGVLDNDTPEEPAL